MKTSYSIFFGPKRQSLHRRRADLRSVVGWILLLYGAIALGPRIGGSPLLAQPFSDDFNRANLDPGRWTFVNPLEDGWVAMTGTGSSDAFLELSVPEGPSHDPWQALNRSVRVMQAATDGDFEIDVHFTSEPDPNEAFQLQGVIVEESLGKWLRFDVYSDGDGLNIFAASTQNGSSSSRINTPITPGDGAYLRINRTGDTWTLSYSPDGATWTEAGSFDYALQVTAVGPFAANHNSGSNPAPAFTAQVDYFFNTASPITPEDGTPEADIWAPFIHNVQTVSGGTQLVVSWYTDEPAIGRLNYGPTSSLGATISEPGLSYVHSLTIPNLSPGQSVFYQVESEDDQGQIATSSIEEVNFDPAGPTIDIWYGDEQDFGQLGNPQEFWINILGNVSDPDGVVDLFYTLDGGSPIDLSIGPDNRRLENSGDFNVDLNWTTLSDGPHTVVITAQDGAGNVSTKTVTVNYTSGNVWPATYTADWSSLTTDDNPTTPDPVIQSLAQVVDGSWSVDNGEIRTIEPGYDRLVAVGDNLWDEYRAKVPVTVHSTSGSFGAGILFRWNGHTDTPVSCPQPKCGYLPLGAIGWFRGGRLEFYQGVSESFALELGVPYWFLMEVENTGGGFTYRLKVWKVGETEPTDWNLEQQEGPGTPDKGTILLIAHQSDVSFGTLEVTPLEDLPNTPPTAQDDEAFVIPGGTVAVPVLNNDTDPDGLLAPGTISIDQGPNHGTILNIDAATGAVTYQHDGSGNLSDQFTYTVEDNDGDPSNVATVEITVTDNPPLAFQSDDFCGNQLQPFWTFVNTPQADGNFALTGSGTSDAYLELSVPGGLEHQIFTSGIGAAHLLQDAADMDFGVEVKFASPLASPQYQMQGVVVKESDDKYLRFEFFSRDPDELFAYGQGFDLINGSPGAFVNQAIGAAGNVPQYMRVERSGDQWSFSYSFNGQDWTLAGQTTFDLTVTALGPYAGNATGNGSPAHTAQIDYFENLAAPIVDEDGCSVDCPITALTAGAQTACDPGTNTYSQEVTVTYSEAPATGTLNVNGQSFPIESSPQAVTLTGLTADGAPVDVTAVFSDDPGCPFGATALFTAPDDCTPGDGPSTLVSDDFCEELGSQWTFVSAANGGSQEVTGTGTADAWLELSVPAGPENQVWVDGIQAAHVLQPANDVDFQVEVKMESPVSTQYQMQGIVVKQDDDNFLRFEVFSAGGNTNVLGAILSDPLLNEPIQYNFDIGTAGIAPIYMRVKREGDQWTHFYSLDGEGWTPAGAFTHAMTVNSVGVYGGNGIGSNAPAHTAQFDYFESVDDPIASEDDCAIGCPITALAAGAQTACDPATNTYSQEVTLTYSDAPATGTLDVNGQSFPIESSPQTVTLTGLPADGATVNVTAVFSDNPGCSFGATALFTAPEDCTPVSGPSTLISDDFCAGELDDAVWTYVPSANPGTLAFSGAGTADAWLELSVPAGPENQPWVNGIQAAHILQPANDVDFEVEVKFESPVNAPQYQQQGVLVKQDGYNFLRFEIYSTNNDMRALAGVLSSQTNTFPLSSALPLGTANVIGELLVAPQYLRVKRIGDEWTLSYSLDGSAFTDVGSFNHALTVNEVGLYSGNATGTSAPAHTAQIDYFENLAAPLGEEDGCSVDCPITALAAGAQTACDPATNTYSQEVTVTYSDAPATGTLDVNGQSFPIESSPQTVTLTGLPADGATVNVTAVFSDNPGCSFGATALFTAPEDCTPVSGPSTLISDDFCAGELDEAVWTYVPPANPDPEGSLAFSGAGTADAWLELSVPAGPENQPWVNGIQAAHILQPANDVDFEVEVKFESPVNQPQFQQQGVIVKQDDFNFLRFEIYSTNNDMRALAGILSSQTNTLPLSSALPLNTNNVIGVLNVAPQFMRVKRGGDQWTLSVSFDGTVYTDVGSFNHALTVNEVGLYSGNATGTSAPAHTAQIDYFENLAAPLGEEDGCSVDCPITALAAGAQTACDPATNTYSQEVVVTYSDAPATGTLDVNDQSFPIESSPQTVVLTGLPADGQPVDVTAAFSDAAGCTASAIALFTAPADCTPPAGPAVVSFVLVNAATNQDVVTLTDGIVLDASILPAQLNIRAVTNPPVVGSVQLQLSGPNSETRTENVAPYAVFGDAGGNYKGESLPLGVYTLTATPFSGSSGSGTPGASLTINFEIAPEPAVFYTVTLSDDGNGSTTGGGSFPAGSTVTVTATPDAGYQFANWTNPGGGVVSTANPYVFALSGDVSLQANFEELPCGGAGFTTYYLDSDEDGYGDPDNPIEACSAPAGYVANADDCDDNDENINPDAEDICDGIDNDCDGSIDEDAGALETYYADADGDTYGDPDSPIQACTQPDGYVDNADDCDDEDPFVNPDAAEVCDGIDNNCDGLTDGEDPALQCGDAVVKFVLINAATNQPVAGYDPLVNGAVLDAGTLPAQLNIQAVTNPPVVGSVQLQLSGPEGESRTESVAPYALFGDSGGNYKGESLPLGVYTLTATPFSGSGGSGTPGASLTITFEIAPEPAVFYTVTLSDDGNGSASGGGSFPAGSTVSVSATPDAGYQFASWTNTSGGVVSTANPYAFALSGDVSLQANFEELPCGGAGFNTYYLDSDEDGYGDPDNPIEACSPPPDYVANADDCDDTDATINPAAEDVCDGVDNDCDGSIDEDAGALETFYADADEDGYGDPGSPVQACTQPDGFVANADDCDDEDASVNPDATEVCDGVDNNCDGLTDGEDPALQCGDAVVKFVLINANTNQPVAAFDPLIEGAVLNLSALPDELNIQAVTNPATVGSVQLQLSGPETETQTENVAPYALFGDANGNYNGESLLAGAYTLTATPYANSGAGGAAGSALTISFTVVEGNGLLTAPAEEGLQPSLVDEELSLQLFPNPAQAQLNIRVALPEAAAEVTLQIRDLSGKFLLRREFEGVKGWQDVELGVDRLAPGMYLLHLIVDEQHVARRFTVIR